MKKVQNQWKTIVDFMKIDKKGIAAEKILKKLCKLKLSRGYEKIKK